VNGQHYRFEELDAARFDDLVASHPDTVVPLEQTPQWAGFERSTGRRPAGIFGYFDDDGALVAIASYLYSTRRLRASMVVVNGPVWFSPRTPAAEGRFLGTVRAQFAADPTVNPIFVRLQVEHPRPPVARALEPGWYDREIVVDLTQDEKTMLASFRPNARQSIRKAARAGVEVRIIDRTERVELFHRELFPIMAETAARDGFSSFDSRYYGTLLTSLAEHTELLVAYLDSVPVCWLITTEYRGYSVYYFAASSAAARKSFAPYLLLWESFRMLKANGNHSCGLTGIVSETYPSLANVTTFKRNFSRNVVVLPTTFDLPVQVLRFHLLSSALKLRRQAPGVLRGILTRLRSMLREPGRSPVDQTNAGNGGIRS
jgi:hypothetical protein